MWENQTAVILASGESMSQEGADTVKRSGYRSIAVNNTFLLAPWADMLYASDYEWWSWAQVHKLCKLTAFHGYKVTLSDPRLPGVLKLKDGGMHGFDPDPGTLRTGGNGGYQAIHIAAHAGCNRILLCGFDMRGGHWHGVHPSPLREHGEGTFTKWIANFATLAPELAKRGIEVLNCTPGSALKVWPIVPLEEALARSVVAA